MNYSPQQDFTENILKEAEGLMLRNKDAVKISDLVSSDGEIWIDISQELHDALDCYPEELSEVTKARIERWTAWVEALEEDRTEELISEHQIKQTLDHVAKMSDDDRRAYYSDMDE